MHNKDGVEKYIEEEGFNIANLPQYGYSFKEEDKGFQDGFKFSMTEEPKYVNPMAEDPMYFLDTYTETPIKDLRLEKPFTPFQRDTPNTKGIEFSPYVKKHVPEPHIRKEYKDYAFEYPQTEEQPIFVNATQYPYIKRRKERRDYLDSLEKKKDVGYQHESRHKHAMKRPRAPSGRFLTKEEAMHKNQNSLTQ